MQGNCGALFRAESNGKRRDSRGHELLRLGREKNREAMLRNGDAFTGKVIFERRTMNAIEQAISNMKAKNYRKTKSGKFEIVLSEHSKGVR